MHLSTQHPTHTHYVCNSLSKAHSVHGYSYGIGKSKDKANGPSQLWTEAATDKEVSST